ncbi:MAG: glycosyltransferase [Chryseobacterium sp.]|nr:glycosyltransferase [Chryseobacterium sp.]
MIKFSVIIPVYNVEYYLERCLDSIISQNYIDLDIIVINDGSTDTSPQICDDYAAKDKRIRVIHQPNKGIPGTRNVGLDSAIGEYICFIDSDDYVEKDFFNILNEALADRQDVLSFDYKIVKGEHIKYIKTDALIVDGKFYTEILSNTASSDFFWFLWRRVYRREFVISKNIAFDESVMFGEDTMFNIELFSYSPSYKHISQFLYNYCSNPMSLARIKYKENLLEKMNNHFFARLRIEEKLGRLENRLILNDISKYYLEHALFLLFQNLKNYDGDKLEELKQIRQSKFYKFSYKNYKYNLQKKGIAIKIFLFNFGFHKTLIKIL